MKKNLLLLLFLYSAQLPAQIVLTGSITDAGTGKPMPGAIIQCLHTQLGTTSDNAGKYSLSLPKGKYTFRIAYIGYSPLETSLELSRDTLADFPLKPSGILTDEVTVAATRAGSAGMAVSTLNKEEIRQLNTGQDVPYLLQLLPSVVVTSDAGTGIGYTGIRIRGSDQTRINVTVNGIPLNDAESQQVYWVDLPDLSSSAENIQVQRGVGSSSNGAGAFGGSINLLTNNSPDSAFAEWTSGYGSFNSIRNTVSFSTGRMKNKFALDGRLSKISSDGYVDRGSADLKSFYLSGSYADEKNVVRLNIFSGQEITYQSWYGVPESRYNNDRQGMQDYIDRNYLDEADAANLLNSGRTYNFYTYDNQVDNYQQDHYQLHFAHTFSKNTVFNAALHYTKGSGYYEEYEKDAALSDYSIDSVFTGSDTISSSDLIRQQWLDNDFYGVVFGLTTQVSDQLQIVAGGSANRYDGDHFGEVIWARFASNSEIRHPYYFNNAVKDDRTVYAKANYTIHKKLKVFADLQYRNVAYDFEGLDPNGTGVPASVNLNFINPKAGVTYFAGEGKEAYVSMAVGNKEPNRDDYTQSTPSSRPSPENLTDFEAGFRYHRNRLRFTINGYYMLYKDQLVLTGAVNDVGNYTRQNIDNSYRTGIEAEAGIALSKTVAVDFNLTFSRNRIKKFTEHTDVYDIDYNLIGQHPVKYTDTPIAFSPDITSMTRISWKFHRNFTAMLIGRYVGQQFLDNSGLTSRMLQDYLVTDFRLEYQIRLKALRELRFNLLVNNLFSTEYASNGYSFGYYYNNSERITENFYYPQALINGMLQVTFRF